MCCILIALPEVLRVVLLDRRDRLLHHIILTIIIKVLVVAANQPTLASLLMLFTCGVHETLAVRVAIIVHCARGSVCILGGKRTLPAVLLIWRRLGVNRQSLVSQICIGPDGHLRTTLALDVQIVLVVIVRLGCLVVGRTDHAALLNIGLGSRLAVRQFVLRRGLPQ